MSTYKINRLTFSLLSSDKVFICKLDFSSRDINRSSFSFNLVLSISFSRSSNSMDLFRMSCSLWVSSVCFSNNFSSSCWIAFWRSYSCSLSLVTALSLAAKLKSMAKGRNRKVSSVCLHFTKKHKVNVIGDEIGKNIKKENNKEYTLCTKIDGGLS